MLVLMVLILKSIEGGSVRNWYTNTRIIISKYFLFQLKHRTLKTSPDWSIAAGTEKKCTVR